MVDMGELFFGPQSRSWLWAARGRPLCTNPSKGKDTQNTNYVFTQTMRPQAGREYRAKSWILLHRPQAGLWGQGSED